MGCSGGSSTIKGDLVSLGDKCRYNLWWGGKFVLKGTLWNTGISLSIFFLLWFMLSSIHILYSVIFVQVLIPEISKCIFCFLQYFSFLQWVPSAHASAITIHIQTKTWKPKTKTGGPFSPSSYFQARTGLAYEKAIIFIGYEWACQHSEEEQMA